MAPVPEFLTNALEKIFFRAAVVTHVKDLSGHFRLVELAGESLRGESWIPGQKMQFHLGNMMTRTYTPTEWNPVDGTAQFLIFVHGNGPGSEWASSLKKGTPCQFIGPRNSLDLTEIHGLVLFFGDETSIGVANAYAHHNQVQQNDFVFEVSSLVETNEVLRCHGLTDAKLVQRPPGDAHLMEVEQVLSSIASRLGLPQWIFTGKAQSIQTLRKCLRVRRILFSRMKVKAYWAEGKSGLD